MKVECRTRTSVTRAIVKIMIIKKKREDNKINNKETPALVLFFFTFILFISRTSVSVMEKKQRNKKPGKLSYIFFLFSLFHSVFCRGSTKPGHHYLPLVPLALIAGQAGLN